VLYFKTEDTKDLSAIIRQLKSAHEILRQPKVMAIAARALGDSWSQNFSSGGALCNLAQQPICYAA
jgi:hypothetical protein